jgi:apolipoprotein N-acyltransferase
LRASHSYLIALLGGLLLWASWPTSPFTFLVFFSWLPLLWIEENTGSYKRLFFLTYLHMLVWNAFTTWWIYHASLPGALMAIILNSGIMCLPWLLMHAVRRQFGKRAAQVAVLAFWISFEFLHHNWELSWPWLTLGNVFATQPDWVQWYSVTGTTGGSIWVLVVNLLAFELMMHYRNRGDQNRKAVHLLFPVVLLVPIIISLISFSRGDQRVASAQKNVVVVQPNVDPYEKFNLGMEELQIRNLIMLSEQQIDSATAVVVWPETAIPVGVWENELLQNPYYQPVWAFLDRHPQISLLTGISSYRNYGSDKKNASATARYDSQQNFYYDAFNTAAMLHPGGRFELYHKAKLVPGVETLPSFLLFIGSWFEDFGGTSGTLGRDRDRAVFADRQHYFVAAPIICYESIYSDYLTQYVRKGANLLAVITNDGWWSNTQGYRQHMNYARLRAIECGRWIARSANTGISCFIDPAGTVYQPQPWDTKASIKMQVEPLEKHTFFVRHGDYLSRIINVVSLVFVLLLIIFRLRKRAAENHTP